jgi:hypothetical protein
MAGALLQREYFASWSREQQRFLAGIVENVPGLTDDSATVLVYLDNEPVLQSPALEYQHPLFLHYLNFADAMRYLTDNPDVDFRLCSPYQTVINPYGLVSGQMMILDSIPGRASDDYNPEALIDRNALPSKRAQSVLSACWLPERCYDPPVSTVSIEFDRAGFGVGWRGPEVTPAGLTFQWTASPQTTIQLPILVDSPAYSFAARLLYTTLPDVFDSLQVQVNGHPVAVSMQLDDGGATVLRGVIPGEFLRQPINEIQFATADPIMPEGGIDALGVAFDWVRLEASARRD